MGYLERVQQPRKIAQKRERVSNPKRGKLSKKGHGRSAQQRKRFYVNKYQQEEEDICRKRTTADRQNWGNGFSLFYAVEAFAVRVRESCNVCNSLLPVAFIKGWSGFLAFAVVFGIHSNFIHSSFTSFFCFIPVA